MQQNLMNGNHDNDKSPGFATGNGNEVEMTALLTHGKTESQPAAL